MSIGKNNFLFISKRLSKTGTKGRESIINLLSVLGIAFGVVALIVILSIMNGFQRGSIGTLLEVSSGHIRLSGSYDRLKQIEQLNKSKSFFVFNESQALIQGKYNRQAGAMVRAVEPESFFNDSGLQHSLQPVSGTINLEKENTIVLGVELARSLAVKVGDEVCLPVIAGSSDVDMFTDNAQLLVTGIFKTGFLAVDDSYCFVSYETGKNIFGNLKTAQAFVKLKNQNSDYEYIANIKQNYPDVEAQSWREYNHSFFGALRTEKNVMIMLVVLIFVVVSVNIYNGMRRTIYERREDIAVLLSLGMKRDTLRFLFFVTGFKIGLIGATCGLIIGLLLAYNINGVFSIVEGLVNFVAAFVTKLIYGADSGSKPFAIFSTDIFYMDKVPSYISFFECCYIATFGLASSSIAALIATKKISVLKPQEILRYE